MNRIKELRKENGISQKVMAQNLGIAQNTLSTWEVGRYDPDNDNLIKIADFFQVSIDYLLGRSDEKKPAIPKDDEPAADEIVVRSRNGDIIKKQYTEKQMKIILKLIDSIDDDDLDL